MQCLKNLIRKFLELSSNFTVLLKNKGARIANKNLKFIWEIANKIANKIL